MSAKRLSLALVLAVSICSAADNPAPLNDEAKQKYADHYNLSLQRNFDATQAVLDKYGARARIAVELKECKLDALADEVMPSKDEIFDVVTNRLVNEGVERDEIMFNYMPAVWTSFSYYQIGFKAAAEALHVTAGPQFCEQATKRANDILQQRKGKK